MLQVIRELARYGAIFIEARHRRWWVACEVILPGGALSGIVKTSGDRLYSALKELIPLAKKEKERLLKELKAPRQQAFEYGAESGWKEIV